MKTVKQLQLSGLLVLLTLLSACQSKAQGRTNGYVYLRCDCNCCGRKFPAYCAGRN